MARVFHTTEAPLGVTRQLSFSGSRGHVGLRQRGVRLCLRKLSARGALIELRQHVARLHRITKVHAHGCNLAAAFETELGAAGRYYFAGVAPLRLKAVAPLDRHG